MDAIYRFNEWAFTLLLLLVHTSNCVALQNGAGELSGRYATKATATSILPSQLILFWMTCKIRNFRFYNVDPELTEIPEHIVQCYTSYELWDRYNRLPSSIDSLVALIRYIYTTEYLSKCNYKMIFLQTKYIFFSFLGFTFVIRKVESQPRTKGWSMGHLAGSLLHNFRFDGIVYDRCIDTTTGAFPIR